MKKEYKIFLDEGYRENVLKKVNKLPTAQEIIDEDVKRNR